MNPAATSEFDDCQDVLNFLDLRRTAYHEAGHAVAGAVVPAAGAAPCLVRIAPTTIDGRRLNAFVLSASPTANICWRSSIGEAPSQERARAHREALLHVGARVLVLAAGPAAARRIHPGYRRGLAADRELALEVTEQLVPEHADRLRWWRAINRVADRFVALPSVWAGIERLGDKLLRARDLTLKGAALETALQSIVNRVGYLTPDNLTPPRGCRLWSPD